MENYSVLTDTKDCREQRKGVKNMCPDLMEIGGEVGKEPEGYSGMFGVVTWPPRSLNLDPVLERICIQNDTPFKK